MVTISMGAGADVPLMQQVADITGGALQRSGRSDRSLQYEADLREVFEKIASGRAMQLVK